ncbi:MAG: hypothetical protein ABSG68_02150 [Thermoguttaceae bacterium]
MSNIAGSVAGTPLAQATGADLERAQYETVSRQRQAQSQQKAEAASGIGETDGEDHQAAERDADGRLPWRRPERPADASDQPDPSLTPAPPPLPKDPSQQSGNLLDLTG